MCSVVEDGDMDDLGQVCEGLSNLTAPEQEEEKSTTSISSTDVSEKNENLEKFLQDDDKMCMKCKDRPAKVIIRVKDPFCTPCLLTHCTHKFRAAIGKSHDVRQNERVLVCYSGGQSSTAMLNFVKDGDSSQRRFRFHSTVCFIDETDFLEEEVMDYRKVVQSVDYMLSNSRLPYVIARLADVFRFCGITDSSTRSYKLKSLFDSCISLTAKRDLLRNVRLKLLCEIAKQENCVKVMVGSCATQLAVDMISAISQGRGEAIRNDTSFSGHRHDDVTIIRPMRDFSVKEVTFYNQVSKLQPMFIPSFDTMLPVNSSIQKLSESFIVNLQSSFPSTVSTVFRTSEKLSIDPNLTPCSFCRSPAHVLDSSSSDVSFDFLCYGCNLTFKDITDKENINILINDFNNR